MGPLVRLLLKTPLLRPVLRPIMRLLLGAIAIPLFRLFLRRVVRLQELDQELEKDLEQWFRASLLLLAATANMEALLFGWLPSQYDWLWIGLRVLLAIGVVQSMPDQDLFAVIHPGPPKIKVGRGFFREFWRQRKAVVKGFLCQHVNRSSPVLAIMAVIFGGEAAKASDIAAAAASGQPMTFASETHILVGWICYVMAIVQYLIIGLVTSRDKALDVLSAFDRQVAEKRRELVEEFDLGPGKPRVDKPAEPPVSRPATRSTSVAETPNAG